MTNEKDSFDEALDILLAHAKVKEDRNKAEEDAKKPLPRNKLDAVLQNLPTPFGSKKS